jgi:hypothetical protein
MSERPRVYADRTYSIGYGCPAILGRIDSDIKCCEHFPFWSRRAYMLGRARDSESKRRCGANCSIQIYQPTFHQDYGGLMDIGPVTAIASVCSVRGVREFFHVVETRPRLESRQARGSPLHTPQSPLGPPGDLLSMEVHLTLDARHSTLNTQHLIRNS